MVGGGGEGLGGEGAGPAGGGPPVSVAHQGAVRMCPLRVRSLTCQPWWSSCSPPAPLQVFRHVLAGDVGSTVHVIEGLHSYDLHLNHDYRKQFGLDCVVPEQLLRGLPGHEIRSSSMGSGVPVRLSTSGPSH